MRQREVDWEEATRLRAQGLTYRRIAERLGCTESAAYYAVNLGRERRQRRIANPANAPRRPWTRSEILDALVAHAEEHGQPPTYNDLGRYGLPWAMSVERRFGTFNQALEAAGLETRRWRNAPIDRRAAA